MNYLFFLKVLWIKINFFVVFISIEMVRHGGSWKKFKRFEKVNNEKPPPGKDTQSFLGNA